MTSHKSAFSVSATSRPKLTSQCRCDVNIANGVWDDLEKHCSAQKHLNVEAALKLQLSVASVVTSDRPCLVTRAELLFTSFFVEHKIMSC